MNFPYWLIIPIIITLLTLAAFASEAHDVYERSKRARFPNEDFLYISAEDWKILAVTLFVLWLVALTSHYLP